MDDKDIIAEWYAYDGEYYHTPSNYNPYEPAIYSGIYSEL